MQPAQKRLVALILGAAVGVALIAAVAFGDVGDPDVPEGAVGIVEEAPEGTITQEELDRAIAQQAARQQLRNPPEPGDEQYEAVRDAALADLLLSRWVRGEAEDRGIVASDRDVDQQLEQVTEEQFGGAKQFQRFLRQQNYTPEEARERVELGVLSDRIQSQVLPENPPVDQSLIDAFYALNKDEQFTQPATRDFREILNPDAARVEEARAILERDDSPASWKDVARRFSTDDATRSEGGLRRDVPEGENEPALDEQVFSAAEGELVGPFQGDAGSYLIQVTASTPEQVTPLSEASEQIRQQLAAAQQQDIAQAFQTDFVDKWTARTFCAEDVTINRCANAPPPPDSCPIDDESERETADPAVLEQGCDAFAASTRPVSPGEATFFGGGVAQGRPQAPLGAAPDEQQPGIPGLTPVPGAPPGAAPGAAPPAPPGG